MTKLYILVGAPAVGKSTWIKNNKTDNSIVVSSDEERIKKYGYLAQEDPQAIFKTMHRKTLDYRKIGSKFNFYLPKVKLLSFEDLEYMRHNNEEIEGVVIINQFHRLIKYKTEYWLDKHKEFSSVMFSDIFSTKNIKLYTQLFVEDSYDDYLASIKQLSNYVDVDKIVSLFSIVEESVKNYNDLISYYKNYTDKEIGLSKDISPFLKSCIFYNRNTGEIRNNQKIIYNIFTNCIEDI